MIEGLGRLSFNTQRIILILGCLVLFIAWFTRVPLTEIDEVRFSEATREMLASGNYIIPHFNGVPRYQKPILYYWVQSVSVRTLGVNEFAARLPSGLIALAMVLLLHAFLWRRLSARSPAKDASALMRSRGAAFLGACALATMPLVAIWARAATTDMTLTCCMTIALLALLQAELDGAGHRWYWLAAGAMGLAFLTKGPIGLVLPGLVWLLYHLRQRDLGVEMRRVPWIVVALIFLTVAAPWYLATWIYDGPGFIQHFFLVENIGRFTSIQEAHGTAHRGLGLLLYLPIALVSLFPYSPFLLRDLVSPFAGVRALQEDNALARTRRFAWVWLLTIIGFFALSKTQLPSYIQGVAPAVAILFALHVLGRVDPLRDNGSRGRWVELTLLGVLTILFVAAPLVLLLGGKVSASSGNTTLPHPTTEILAGVIAVFGLMLFIGLVTTGIRNRQDTMVCWLMVGWGALLAVLLVGFAPLYIQANYGSPVEAGLFLRQMPATVPVLYVADSPSEDVVYYARRKIEWYPVKDGDVFRVLRRLRAIHGEVIILTDHAGLALLREIGEVTILKQAGNILVVRNNTTHMK